MENGDGNNPEGSTSRVRSRVGYRRIAEEIEKVPKVGPRFTQRGKSKGGRGAIGIPGTSRARLLKLVRPRGRRSGSAGRRDG